MAGVRNGNAGQFSAFCVVTALRALNDNASGASLCRNQRRCVESPIGVKLNSTSRTSKEAASESGERSRGGVRKEAASERNMRDRKFAGVTA